MDRQYFNEDMERLGLTLGQSTDMLMSAARARRAEAVMWLNEAGEMRLRIASGAPGAATLANHAAENERMAAGNLEHAMELEDTARLHASVPRVLPLRRPAAR